MLRFDRQRLKDRLESLTPVLRFLFALCVAQRLFPLYLLYSSQTKRGQPEALQSSLDRLWQWAESGQTGHADSFLNDYESLIPAGDLVPASQVDSHPLSGLAEFAILALHSACDCQRKGDSESAVWAAESGGYAAVDSIANALEGVDYGSRKAENAILKKDYVQAELQRQLRDIDELEVVFKNGMLIDSVAKELRRRAVSEGISLRDIVAKIRL